MRNEITAVTSVENFTMGGWETYRKGVLLTCDVDAAQKRINHAVERSNGFNETSVELNAGLTSYLFWDEDQPIGITSGDWVVAVCADKGGVIVTFWDTDTLFVDPLDLETQWIDVLALARRFFAIEQSEQEPDLELFC